MARTPKSSQLLDTVMAFKSNTDTSKVSSESNNEAMKIKAKSATIVPVTSVEDLKQHISAPSYFNCFKENEVPPFVRPAFEPLPKLMIRQIFNENDVIHMIGSAEFDKENGLKEFLGHFLVEKQIIRNYNLSEKNYLISLLKETINYAAQRNFSPLKLSVLLTIYLDCHLYFKWYYWQSPAAVWNYFKEMMIRHTIEDSPTGQEIFEPQECYDIVTHFHTVYLTNLPLIHILTFGTFRLKLEWPFPATKRDHM